MKFEIEPKELKQLMEASSSDILLVDVRTQDEYNTANIGGKLIPLDAFETRYQELDPNKHIVVHCHHGMRSAKAVEFLKAHNFAKVQNLAGGIDRWSEDIDSNIPRY